MAVERYISSDSHVLEPADLWVEQMDKAFRAQAPRVVHNLPGYEGDYWLFGDRAPVPRTLEDRGGYESDGLRIVELQSARPAPFSQQCGREQQQLVFLSRR